VAKWFPYGCNTVAPRVGTSRQADVARRRLVVRSGYIWQS
jgi:hypothetical protein